MKNNLIVLVLIIAFGSMSYGQTKKEKIPRKERIQLNYELAKEIVSSEAYTFSIQWMNSRHFLRRDIRDRGAFLTVNAQNAEGYFPYFGAIRSGGSYVMGGVQFDNEIQDYITSFDDDKKRVNIRFKVRAAHEILDVDILLSKGLYANITIHSSIRDSISYEGYIAEMDE